MRYDVRTLDELKEVSAECDSQDRIVLFFTDAEPQRFRVYNDRLVWEPCDRNGNGK
jgi:hypothetical protein